MISNKKLKNKHLKQPSIIIGGGGYTIPTHPLSQKYSLKKNIGSLYSLQIK